MNYMYVVAFLFFLWRFYNFIYLLHFTLILALTLYLTVALFIWTVVWNEFCDSLTDCSSLYFVVIRRSLVSKAPIFHTDTMVRLRMDVCVCVLSVIVFILILWNILLSLYFSPIPFYFCVMPCLAYVFPTPLYYVLFWYNFLVICK